MVEKIYVKILGTRGSAPVFNEQTGIFGGNSSGVFVRCGGQNIILDAGTGIHKLSREEITNRKLSMLISHCHIDHIIGFPIFKPLFDEEMDIGIYGPSDGRVGIKDRISALMQPPLWPVGTDVFRSKPRFTDIKENTTFNIGDITVSTIGLKHPGGSIGYRLKYGSRKLAYLVDAECDRTNEAIIDFVRGADIVICDGQYNDDEYKIKRGWGHSSFTEVAAMAAMAGAGRLLITHHDPYRTDDELLRFNEDIKDIFNLAEFARENTEFTV